MLRRTLLFTTLLVSATAVPAEALTWPDAAIRAEQNLRSPDAEERRRAARELVSLGAKKAEPLVLKALNDSDLDVRVNAAASAIKLRLSLATELVLPWLGDPELRLRIAACDVAAALPDDRATVPLARTLGDADPVARTRAAFALGQQRTKEAVAPLLGRIDDPNPTVRVEVIRALTKIADPRSVVPLIGKAQDSTLEVKREALRALGELGDPRATQPLVFALRDPAVEAKMDALNSLARLRQDSTVDAIAALLSDRNAQVRQAAAAALGTHGSLRAATALASSLGGIDDSSAVAERTPLRQALAAAHGNALVVCERVLLQPKNRAAAASCAWVAGELGASALSPSIVVAMRRGTLAPVNALLALRGTANPADLSTALEYLGDPSEPVRKAAIAVAVRLLDPSHPDGRAVDPILQDLADARLDHVERSELATLLGRTGSPRAVAPLLTLASNTERDVRLSAISALASVSPDPADASKVSDALFSFLANPDAAIRFRSSVALGNVGSAASLERVLRALDGTELDRTALLRTLPPLLARVGTEASLDRLHSLFGVSSAADRDALYEAFARVTSARSTSHLVASAKTGDLLEHRSIANAVARHPSPDAARLLASMIGSPSSDVALDALWSAGTSSADLSSELIRSLSANDPDARSNAVASLARSFERTNGGKPFASAACPLLNDPFPLVRANVLVGLSLVRQRCADGAKERALLGGDPSSLVRAAAARALSGAASSSPTEDQLSLHRCSDSDPDSAVANACSDPILVSLETEPVTFFVVDPKSGTPSINTRYVVRYASGLYRVGTTDRRGAVFDPAAAKGVLRLVRVDETSQGRMR